MSLLNRSDRVWIYCFEMFDGFGFEKEGKFERAEIFKKEFSYIQKINVGFGGFYLTWIARN